MSKKLYPIVIEKDAVLSSEIAEKIFQNIIDDTQRLEIETYGVWGMPISVKGLAVSMDFKTGAHTIYGYRTMYNVKQSGYDLEGHVSIKGKKYSCFTSNTIFRLENGKSVCVEIIFPRVGWDNVANNI